MTPGRPPAVRSGLEVLLAEGAGRLADRRIGLLANHASVNSRLAHAADLLAERAELALLLGPEHGLRGEAQDMEATDSGVDPGTGLPVHSLYGSRPDTLAPPPAVLAGLDLLVCDLQDIGARYYTFAATLFHVLEAAAAAGLPVLVLDRPNPLDGETLEGPGLEDGFHSFVGRLDVPVRHGLTMAELGRLFVAERGLDVALDVVPMAGWRRDMAWEETGLPWVPPSPNMPTLDTARVYPGGCLVEGTELSEGRGTTRPFELVGAPWLDAPRLARDMTGLEHAGAAFRPHWFRPGFQKWRGRTCAGVQVHVTDSRALRSFAVYVDLLAAIRRQDPGRFQWRREPYEFESDRAALDLLAGSSGLRQALEAGSSAADLAPDWLRAQREYRERRRPILLYPESR